MADFGQYHERDVLQRLKSKKGTGVCERCGNKTRVNTLFGMTICNPCWKKQTKR